MNTIVIIILSIVALITYAAIGRYIFLRDRKMGSDITGIIVAIFWFVLPFMWLLGKWFEYMHDLDSPRDRHGKIIYQTKPNNHEKI